MMKGVTLFTFDNDERTDTFWHSSAHILEEIEMLSEHIDETLDKDVAEEGTEELTNQVNNNGPLIHSTAQLEQAAVRASSGDVSLCTLSIAGALLLGVLKYS